MFSWVKKEYTSVVDALLADFANLKAKLENIAETELSKAKAKAEEVEQHTLEAAKATKVAQKIGEIIS